MGAHSLLTPAAAAQRLGLSVAELIELIEAGKGPACVKIRRTGRFNMGYLRNSVLIWFRPVEIDWEFVASMAKSESLSSRPYFGNMPCNTINCFYATIMISCVYAK